jgi:exopolysaccharide production protein ExoY
VFESSSFGLVAKNDIDDVDEATESFNSPIAHVRRLALVSDSTLAPTISLDVPNDNPIISTVVGEIPSVASRRANHLLDTSIAIAALIVFGPLMLLIAGAIKVSSKGPILFRQDRLGEGGQKFQCLKFRTMRTDAEAILAALLADPVARAEWDRDHKMRDDPRITLIGRILRKTSLDELPQIFNVLLGEMSIVGPRPIVAAEVGRYGSYIHAYYSVRPGITGLWQVSGRNHTTYRRRVACDVTYARSHSARGDFVIIARTIPAVLLARGAY